MYSTDPVADAASYSDSLEALNTKFRENAAHYEEVIRKVVEREHDSDSLIPATIAGGTRIVYVFVAKVVCDEISFGAPREALMNVFAHSACPLVAELRKAIADSYIKSNLDFIAEAAL